MKKVYDFLKTLLWCFIGAFIGGSLYHCYDYKTHPDLYAMQSVPWYLKIVVLAIFTVIVDGILLIIMCILKRKMK